LEIFQLMYAERSAETQPPFFLRVGAEVQLYLVEYIRLVLDTVESSGILPSSKPSKVSGTAYDR
jgi:hypothetical protein